jgi:hypothetical protein
MLSYNDIDQNIRLAIFQIWNPKMESFRGNCEYRIYNQERTEHTTAPSILKNQQRTS